MAAAVTANNSFTEDLHSNIPVIIHRLDNAKESDSKARINFCSSFQAAARVTVDKKKVESFFSKYKDPSDPSKIGTEGVIRLLEDLHLDPASVLVLIFAWKLKAATQCEFSKEEFVKGKDCFTYWI